MTQFPNLKNEDNDSTFLIGLLNRVNKIMQNSSSARCKPRGGDRYVASDLGSMKICVDFGQNHLRGGDSGARPDRMPP